SSACVLRFRLCSVLFCVNSTPPSRPYILSLHDALPILDTALTVHSVPQMIAGSEFITRMHEGGSPYVPGIEYTNISTRHDEFVRSEEHTSELQSRFDLVCRLLLEKQKDRVYSGRCLPQ